MVPQYILRISCDYMTYMYSKYELPYELKPQMNLESAKRKYAMITPKWYTSNDQITLIFKRNPKMRESLNGKWDSLWFHRFPKIMR